MNDTHEVVKLNVNEIVPGNNDRTTFDETALQELADSLREYGLIQPITVRQLDDTDLYQIIAGERRYRAARLLGWAQVPCIIIDADDEQAAALMLAENVARKDLDPIDEARAYQSRMDLYGWTIDQLAEKAGVSTIRVQFRLKLLRLTPEVQQLIRTNNLQLGYAQILSDSGLDTNRQRIAVAKLRDNPNPTPGWFRGVINILIEQQAQAGMFEQDLLNVQSAPALAALANEPPHPGTTQPPKIGRTPRERLQSQIEFWTRAADQWQRIGKPFKRQECQAAAQALQAALAVV